MNAGRLVAERWVTGRAGDSLRRALQIMVRAARKVACAWCSLFWVLLPAAALGGELVWDLERLAEVPKWERLTKPQVDGISAIAYEGLPFQGRATQVFAWLGVPEVEPGAKVPAIVLVHGGGGTAFEEWVRLWVDRGYAAIAMDTCGQVPVGNYGRWVRNVSGGPAGWGGFDQIEWAREDQWTYHAVADVLLAHSLIRSIPEVDADRTGITGISWGGYLTCIAAGIDSRFKLAVPVYGCGYYRETFFAADLGRMEPAAADRWMEWWDPSVYLGAAEMPMLWVNGSNDFAYFLHAMQRSYRLPSGPRTLCVRLRMPHAHGGAGENPEEIRVFADSLLRGGKRLPELLASGRDGRSVWVEYTAEVPVVRAELNYTMDAELGPQSEWVAAAAELVEGRAVAELGAGVRHYYFNLFDERDCVVSSEHAVVVDTPGGE